MHSWKLVLQRDLEHGRTVFVPCKLIRWFPVENPVTGEVELRPRPRNQPVYQILVEGFGEQHRLKMSRRGLYVNYVWQQPDRLEQPKLKVGLGKGGRRHIDSRRTIVDSLAPPRRVPGEKSEFAGRSEYVAHLSRILGGELCAVVMEMFDAHLGAI